MGSVREAIHSFFNILVVSAYIFLICIHLVFFVVVLFSWLKLRLLVDGTKFKLACRKYVKGHSLERLCFVYNQELKKARKMLSLGNIVEIIHINFKQFLK
ncbi:MAG: hypothetical protein QW291_07060 [Thermofilaceae archaeon]